jgi:hypothetical protein
MLYRLYCSSGNTLGVDEYVCYSEIGADDSWVRYVEVKSDGTALRYDREHAADQYGVLPEGKWEEEEATMKEYGIVATISSDLLAVPYFKYIGVELEAAFRFRQNGETATSDFAGDRLSQYIFTSKEELPGVIALDSGAFVPSTYMLLPRALERFCLNRDADLSSWINSCCNSRCWNGSPKTCCKPKRQCGQPMKRRLTKKTSPKTNTTHWDSKPPTWPPAKLGAPKPYARRWPIGADSARVPTTPSKAYSSARWSAWSIPTTSSNSSFSARMGAA